VPSIEEFGPRYITGHAKANRQKASTVATKQRVLRVHINPLFGSKKLDELKNEDVQQLKAKLAKHNAKTVNNVLSVFRHMLKTAVEWNVIDRLPCSMKQLKVSAATMSFYDVDQYARLVEAATKCGQRELIMVLLGGDASLRRGEMVALRWTDIDFRRGNIGVHRSDWNGIEDVPKGGRRRIIPMTKALAAALSAHKHLRGPRVLYENDGSPVDANTLQNWMEVVTRRAGLEPTRGLHILRHTFCSHLAMRGASTKAIQELAGHQHITTTMGYMHLSPSARESAIRLLDDRGAAPNSGEVFGEMLEKEVVRSGNSNASA
jgi:integrase